MEHHYTYTVKNEFEARGFSLLYQEFSLLYEMKKLFPDIQGNLILIHDQVTHSTFTDIEGNLP